MQDNIVINTYGELVIMLPHSKVWRLITAVTAISDTLWFVAGNKIK